MSADSSVKRDRRSSAAWSITLVVLHLFATIAVCIWYEGFSFHFNLIPRSSMLLLGWWLACTRVRVAWKLSGWCLGITFLFICGSHNYVTRLSHTIPWGVFDWSGYIDTAGGYIVSIALWLVFLFVVGNWVTRRLGWMRTTFGENIDHMSPEKVRRWQYTLSDLFLVSFAMALSLGLIMWTAPYPAWVPMVFFHGVSLLFLESDMSVYTQYYALNGVFVTFLAAWLVLGKERLTWRLLGGTIGIVVWPLVLFTMLLMTLFVLYGDLEKNYALGVKGCFMCMKTEYYHSLALLALLVISFVMLRFASRGTPFPLIRLFDTNRVKISWATIRKRFHVPLVTLVLVGIILVFNGRVLAFNDALKSSSDSQFVNVFQLALSGEPWRPFISWLPHLDRTHLFVDCCYLLVAGWICEELYGSKKTLIVFLLGNWAGAWAATFLDPHYSSLVGSSDGTHALVAYFCLREGFRERPITLGTCYPYFLTYAYLLYLALYALVTGKMPWPFGHFDNGGADHLGGILMTSIVALIDLRLARNRTTSSSLAEKHDVDIQSD